MLLILSSLSTPAYQLFLNSLSVTSQHKDRQRDSQETRRPRSETITTCVGGKATCASHKFTPQAQRPFNSQGHQLQDNDSTVSKSVQRPLQIKTSPSTKASIVLYEHFNVFYIKTSLSTKASIVLNEHFDVF